jgi:hypothetical protein
VIPDDGNPVKDKENDEGVKRPDWMMVVSVVVVLLATILGRRVELLLVLVLLVLRAMMRQFYQHLIFGLVLISLLNHITNG